jgi:hypothetical protein
VATLAELDEPPFVPVEPWVLTCKSAVLSRLHVTAGTQTLAAELVSGPPPVEGRVTVGSGPEITVAAPNGVTFTDSPNAPPETLVTVACAGLAASESHAAPSTKTAAILDLRDPSATLGGVLPIM